LKKGHFTIWWQILQTHCSANKDNFVSTEPEEKQRNITRKHKKQQAAAPLSSQTFQIQKGTTKMGIENLIDKERKKKQQKNDLGWSQKSLVMIKLFEKLQPLKNIAPG